MDYYKNRTRYTNRDKELKMGAAASMYPHSDNMWVQKPDNEQQFVETVQFDDLCKVDYNGMLASVDFLEFTVFGMTWRDVIKKVLHLELSDFTDTGKGGGGYTNMYRADFSDIRVLFNTNERIDMGVHVTIPGDGCRALFARVLPSVLIKTVLDINKHADDRLFPTSSKFTRIDLAIDDIGAVHFFPHELMQFIDAGVVKSRWRSWETVKSGKMHSATLTGDTVYLGSRSSDLFCRIYDKTKERIAKDDVEVPENWVRWELVCKADRAQVACEMLFANNFAIGEILFGVLSNYFAILEPNENDSHRDRWPLNQRWLNFLGEVQPVKLFRVLKPERTLENVEDWIINQCGPSISAIIRVYGVDWVEREIGLNAWRKNKRLEKMTLLAAEQLEKWNKTHDFSAFL